MNQRAVLAGGCFWGMQDLIRKRAGIVSTRVGYTGGDVANATYRNHGTHAEGIEIVFDPAVTSYRNILEFFFQIHDPTTKNRQGNDQGLSYRSAIYYVDEEQKRVAEDTIADVDASGLWGGKVVTEVEPVGDFWEAEPEHQDYLEKLPGGYTCHFARPNWVLPKRAGDAKPPLGAPRTRLRGRLGASSPSSVRAGSPRPSRRHRGVHVACCAPRSATWHTCKRRSGRGHRDAAGTSVAPATPILRRLLPGLVLALVGCGSVGPPPVDTRYELRIDGESVTLAAPYGMIFEVASEPPVTGVNFGAEAPRTGDVIMSSNVTMAPVEEGTFDCAPDASGASSTAGFHAIAFLPAGAKMSECSLTIEYASDVRVVGVVTGRALRPAQSGMPATPIVIEGEFDVPLERR